jgi:hypothetical protein
LASIWEKPTVGNDEIENNSVIAGCSSEIRCWIHACGRAWYSSVGPAFHRRGPTRKMGRYVIRGLLQSPGLVLYFFIFNIIFLLLYSAAQPFLPSFSKGSNFTKHQIMRHKICILLNGKFVCHSYSQNHIYIKVNYESDM